MAKHSLATIKSFQQDYGGLIYCLSSADHKESNCKWYFKKKIFTFVLGEKSLQCASLPPPSQIHPTDSGAAKSPVLYFSKEPLRQKYFLNVYQLLKAADNFKL